MSTTEVAAPRSFDNDNNNNDGSSSSSSDDLSKLLENMDIDQDFNIWSSFRESMSGSQMSSPGERSSVAEGQEVVVVEEEDDEEEKERSKRKGKKKKKGATKVKVLPSAVNNENNQEQESSSSLSSPAATSPTAMEMPKHTDLTATTSQSDPRLLEKHDKAYWTLRLQREDVYSHKYYRPTEAEQAELRDLEQAMGQASRKPNSLRKLFQKKRSTSSKLEEQQQDEEARQAVVVWNQLVYPDKGTTSSNKLKQPQSILLKRGPCLWRQTVMEENDRDNDDDNDNNNSSKSDSNGNHQQLQQAPRECEVILLTHGLVIASVFTSKEQKVVKRVLSRAIPLSQIEYVKPGGDLGELEWQVVVRPNHSNDTDDDEDNNNNNNNKSSRDSAAAAAAVVVWTFTCSSSKQQRNWIKAMEQVLVQHYLQTGLQPGLGWEYRLIRKPGFGLAVTEQVDEKQVVVVPASVLLKLDHYRGYAPLHYAVRCQNTAAVRCLLEMGADPNQPDRDDGRSPMDYALRDPAPTDIQELLSAHGGKRTHLSDTDRGALFGQVAAVEQKREEQKRELEQKRQAEAAQQEMAENMRLLQQRGEKIDDLGNKATELNQGAQDFASMAKQLKEKSKKDSKWLPFL